MGIVDILDHLRELNIASLTFRMLLGLLFGGIIGIERGSKQRAAGFRTYMLVCLGAVLTMLLGQYEQHMLTHVWHSTAEATGLKTDVARFGAQVISGIGFLGAGTILVTGRQEVKGLTTGAGLWTCACMGLAIGAGFYECVIPAFGLILLSIRILPWVETVLMERARNLHLYVEFESMDSIHPILCAIKSSDSRISHVEINPPGASESGNLSAIFSVRLKSRHHRERMFAQVAKLPDVYTIESI